MARIGKTPVIQNSFAIIITLKFYTNERSLGNMNIEEHGALNSFSRSVSVQCIF